MSPPDVLWLPLAVALLGGGCVGAWATALHYRHRLARDVERRVQAGLTVEARAWRVRLGAVCARCAKQDGYARLLRVVAEEGRTGD